MEWKIIPLESVGPLKIGMLAEEVASILDPMHEITSRDEVFDGSISEHRGLDVPACSYDGKFLRGIDTNKRVSNVTFDSLDIFKSKPKDVMLRFYEANKGAEYGLGLLYFDNLSIASNGFFTDDGGFFTQLSPRQDNRTLSVYKMGSFDSIKPHIRKIDLTRF